MCEAQLLTTQCIIHGADKEDIFLFLLSATAYTPTLAVIFYGENVTFTRQLNYRDKFYTCDKYSLE